jgi:hypothetical protein
VPMDDEEQRHKQDRPEWQRMIWPWSASQRELTGCLGRVAIGIAGMVVVLLLLVPLGCSLDASVDDSTVGSNGVPGNDTSSPSSTFQLGEGVILPEGLPAIGIPSDATITKASGSKETGYYLVIYYSKKPVKDVFQGHLDALAKLGYTVDWKDLTSSADGEVIMSIGATDGEGKSQVSIRGGGKSGSGGNGYWVQTAPFLKS